MADNNTDKPVRARELTLSDRKAAFALMLVHSENGVVPANGFVSAAQMFGGKVRRFQNLWRDTLSNMLDCLSNHAEDHHIFEEIDTNDPFEAIVLLQEKKSPLSLFPPEVFQSGKIGSVGKKRKYDRDELKDNGAAVPCDARNSYRALAGELKISSTTAHRLLKDEKVFWVSKCSLNPHSTDVNKEWRFQFCADQIEQRTVDFTRSKPKFKDQFNEVHVDEKWFFLEQEGRKICLVDGEVAPVRRVKHKKHIVKVMFLCAQARPRGTWDGKIGIWPIGSFEPAKRNSVNRKAGTLEWKNKNLDGTECLNLMINKVVPAIVEKWPRRDWNNNRHFIKIQQDGAPGHKSNKFNSQWQEGLQKLVDEGSLPEGKIRLVTQPSNSPDLNILDLGFFRALQTAYCRYSPKDVNDLLQFVVEACDVFPANKINRIFLTLQTIYNGVLEHHGDNGFPLVHLNKTKMEREGTLPVSLEVSDAAIGVIESLGDEMDSVASDESLKSLEEESGDSGYAIPSFGLSDDLSIDEELDTANVEAV